MFSNMGFANFLKRFGGLDAQPSSVVTSEKLIQRQNISKPRHSIKILHIFYLKTSSLRGVIIKHLQKPIVTYGSYLIHWNKRRS